MERFFPYMGQPIPERLHVLLSRKLSCDFDDTPVGDIVAFLVNINGILSIGRPFHYDRPLTARWSGS